MKLSFGAAYFFTESYLNGYDKQQFKPTRQEDKDKFIEHLVQKTQDNNIYETDNLQYCESHMMVHPTLGYGYAIITNKDTDDLSNYKRRMGMDFYVNCPVLISTLDNAQKLGHLQVFDKFI